MIYPCEPKLPVYKVIKQNQKTLPIYKDSPKTQKTNT